MMAYHAVPYVDGVPYIQCVERWRIAHYSIWGDDVPHTTVDTAMVYRKLE